MVLISIGLDIALIKNNARVGAAMALSKAKMDSSSLRPSSPSIKPSTGSDYIVRLEEDGEDMGKRSGIHDIIQPNSYLAHLTLLSRLLRRVANHQRRDLR